LQLGFDAPWEVRTVILPKDLIRNQGVGVFRINEETVHVEDAGADRGKAGVADRLVQKTKRGALNTGTGARNTVAVDAGLNMLLTLYETPWSGNYEPVAYQQEAAPR
jgi:hypothetical protein